MNWYSFGVLNWSFSEKDIVLLKMCMNCDFRILIIFVYVLNDRDEECVFDGYIVGFMYFFSSIFEENFLKLIEEVKNKEIVVFYCVFS